MRHPPYHLRPNKAVDRLALVEAIRRLESLYSLEEYTYYGFGGPYLEDFRLLYELCPEIKMVSIEENADTYKRQQFHLPCGTLHLEKNQFKTFLATFETNDRRSIFWLDYTGLNYGNFADFIGLLTKSAVGSMIKITLRAEPRDYLDRPGEEIGKGAERFRRQFGAIMPDPSASPPRSFQDYCCLLKDMTQVAAQKALPGSMPLTFQPISCFQYSDGTGMFTMTGLVCARNEVTAVQKAYQGWQFANLNWGKPKEINVPILSTKERLHLQEMLPLSKHAGRKLRVALGYLIDSDRRTTEVKLRQYAEYHRYFPYFMKAIP